MKRSRILAGATAASLALGLAACSSDDGGGGGGDGGDVTLGFYTDKAAWEPSFDAMNKESAAQGSTLDFTGYSDATAYDSFIKQSFRTKKVPDLFTWHTGSQLADLVDQGLVAETTDLWTKAEADGLVPEGLKDNYTYDGKQYCVPLNVAYWAVYYNKKVFADNGVEVPTTFDELTAAAKKLKAAGVTPFHQMNIIFEFAWFQALLAGNAPDVYQGLQTGDASYLDPKVTEVMDQWKSMIDDGYYNDPGVTTDPQTMLKNGDVAMAYFGTFLTGQLTDVGARSGEDYGIFTMPSMNPASGNQMVLETGPLCVGKGSENEQAALDYSAWWMSDDAQNAWSSSRGDVSFNPHVKVEDPELQDLVDQVNGGDFTIQQRYLEANPLPVYTLSTEIFGDFVTNAPDPAPGLQRLQDEADTYWAEQG
ncbi:ABC transporter substrate-binding protein [Isoptericola sp. NPDC057559]|uniref:ABC transporter substrate-binding protein n=1 Tax=Isoptericola sp. NPDC057559 TaxID=3346168 RepID=UPI003691F591